MWILTHTYVRQNCPLKVLLTAEYLQNEWGKAFVLLLSSKYANTLQTYKHNQCLYFNIQSFITIPHLVNLNLGTINDFILTLKSNLTPDWKGCVTS